jgi:hypothetical protein
MQKLVIVGALNKREFYGTGEVLREIPYYGPNALLIAD